MYGKQANDTQLVNWAAEIKIRAERKCGELLGDTEKLKGRPEKASHAVRLSDLGLTRMQSSRYQQIANPRFVSVTKKAQRKAGRKGVRYKLTRSRDLV